MNSSSNSTRDNSTPWAKAYEGLRQHATKVTATYPEEEWLPAMRNQADELGLGLDVKDADLIEVIDQASKTGNDKYEYRPGIKWDVQPPTFILDTLIAEGRFHTIVAPAKLGKTTLALQFLSCLFDEQVQQYLNLLLNSNKKYTLYLIGPDMCQKGWLDALSACGLADPQGNFATPVKVVRPEECLDGLSSECIRRYGDMARAAKASGEEPIFLFDCYSTMADNTPSMKADEVSGLYYKPMRALKNEMSRTGATTILLHHASKSSAKNNVVGSGAGNSKFSRIPDQLIDMKWISPDVDNPREHGIELRAVGRLGDEVHKLIGPGDSGRLEDIGDIVERKRTATLRSIEITLTGDRERVCDFVAELAAVGQAASVAAVMNQLGNSWVRSKAYKILEHLLDRGLVTDFGQVETGGRPGRLYMHWSYTWGHNRPQGFAPTDAPQMHQNENPVVAGIAPKKPVAPHAGEAVPHWQLLEPGTKVEIKQADGTWQDGWIIKTVNKATGEHEAWQPPNLSRTKCRLRAGLEVRETLVIDDREAL